ncbi:MAG: hypothetical protein AABX40_09285 [Candidatus Hydrothermarchaeota archaeon]
MLQIRDFLESREHLIFAVTSYYHPADRCLAFLRYYPAPQGERRRGGERFAKVASTEASFSVLQSYPWYLFPSEVTGSLLQAVPMERIGRVYHPADMLAEIYEGPKDPLEERALELSEFLSGIPREKKGVTGSLLVGLHDPRASDIDFVVYGLKEHARAREALRKGLEEGALRPPSREDWYRAYKKRFPRVETLTFEEFLWYEGRKYHKGIVGGAIFDILLVREPWEIEGRYSERRFKRGEETKLRCLVTDASLAFDSPAVYKVEGEVEEVVSFTHTYAGQALEGEEIEVSGRLEEVQEAGKSYMRVVVGTTREAEGEYIKVIKKRGEGSED